MSNTKASKSQKVKIIKSFYRQESDLVEWDILFDNGEEQAYCWPSIDLISALGIKGKPSVEQLHDFCKMMEGKVINFVLEGVPQYKVPKGTKQDQEKINNGMYEHFMTFQKNVEKKK